LGALNTKLRNGVKSIYMHVNGAKLSHDVGAKMSTPIFFHGTKMSMLDI